MRLALLVSLWLAVPAGADMRSVTLAWDPSADASVMGYYVHYGTASGTYTGRVDSGGATQASVGGLVPGQTYFFVVTAYNQQRIESVPSEEIFHTVPSPVLSPARLLPGDGSTGPRLEFRVKPTQVYEVQASEDLLSWRTIYCSVSLSTNWLEYVDPQAAWLPQRFYRLAVPDRAPVPGWLRLLPGAVPRGMVCLRPSVGQGQRYRIEASEDLQTWTLLHEGVCAATPPLDFVDSQAVRYSRRFYRLLLPDTASGHGALQIFPGNVLQGSRLQIAALGGQRYRIEASPDMQTWQTIGEGVSTSTEPVDLVDSQAAQHPARFYRLAFD